MTAPTTERAGQPGQPERASGSRMGAGAALPRAGSRAAAAAAAPRRCAGPTAPLLQIVLFWAGAIMMPLGIVIILLGYYGVANAPQDFDREAYQYSGGFLGLGRDLPRRVPLLRGLAGQDRRRQQRRLRPAWPTRCWCWPTSPPRPRPPWTRSARPTRCPVTAGDGTTLHRRDCALIAHRDDLAARRCPHRPPGVPRLQALVTGRRWRVG